MTDWLDELSRLGREPAVLVTVAGTRGSAPRETGAAMLVTATDSRGTIGGGALEYRAVDIAARLLRDGAVAGCLRRFPLGADCGQCCGGVVDLLFEPLAGVDCLAAIREAWSVREDAVVVTTFAPDGRPQKALVTAQRSAGTAGDNALAAARAWLAGGGAARRVDTPGRGEAFLLLEPLAAPFPVAVFGAGHVGSALVHTLAPLPLGLRWVDGRRGLFPAGLPANVQCIESTDPLREVAAMPPGTSWFVMTHSHALDLELVARILVRGDFAYLGLIGSVTKRRRFERRLRERGVDEAALSRLRCPIGVDGIAGKHPAEIAIAAAAELLRVRERRAAAADGQTATIRALRDQGAA